MTTANQTTAQTTGGSSVRGSCGRGREGLHHHHDFFPTARAAFTGNMYILLIFSQQNLCSGMRNRSETEKNIETNGKKIQKKRRNEWARMTKRQTEIQSCEFLNGFQKCFAVLPIIDQVIYIFHQDNLSRQCCFSPLNHEDGVSLDAKGLCSFFIHFCRWALCLC